MNISDVTGGHFKSMKVKVKSLSRPHGLQPTRVLHPWDFPGNSTGVGCHWCYRWSFQIKVAHHKKFKQHKAESCPLSPQNCACMHAKSLQSCLTLCNPVECSPPGSSVQGILQARILEWAAVPRDLPDPGITPWSLGLLPGQVAALPPVPSGQHPPKSLWAKSRRLPSLIHFFFFAHTWSVLCVLMMFLIRVRFRNTFKEHVLWKLRQRYLLGEI